MTDKINGYNFWEIVRIWEETPGRLLLRGKPKPKGNNNPRHTPDPYAFLDGEYTVINMPEELYFGMTVVHCHEDYKAHPERWEFEGDIPGEWREAYGSEPFDEFSMNLRAGKKRRKPEPTYIPYTVETFPLDRVPWVRWKMPSRRMILVDMDVDYVLVGHHSKYKWDDALDRLHWADTGEPFGQKVESPDAT